MVGQWWYMPLVLARGRQMESGRAGQEMLSARSLSLILQGPWTIWHHAVTLGIDVLL